MPRRYSTREVAASLERIGFVVVRQRGSHLRYSGQLAGEVRNVTLVAGQAPIPPGTLRAIRTQLGLSREVFEYLLENQSLPPTAIE